MKHLVEFPLKEGGSVVIEVEEPESEGTIRAGRGDVIVKAKEALEDALGKVLPAAHKVVEQLRSAESRPDEIEVTFGVKLSTAAGAVIAWASGEANFNVAVRWVGKKEATISS